MRFWGRFESEKAIPPVSVSARTLEECDFEGVFGPTNGPVRMLSAPLKLSIRSIDQ